MGPQDTCRLPDTTARPLAVLSALRAERCPHREEGSGPGLHLD